MEFDEMQSALCDLDKLIPDAIAQIMGNEDPEKFLKWLQKKLPEYAEPDFWENAPPGVFNAFAVQCQHLIWNSLPLPGNNFVPRPLPLPGRNDPCLCGSGLKYKQCCASLPKPAPLDPLDIWPFVLDNMPRKKLLEALAQNRLPLEGVVTAAMEHWDEEDYEKEVELLAPLFSGSLKKPRPRLEVALEMLCDAYAQLGDMAAKVALLERITTEAPASLLRAAAWQRLVTIYLDQGDTPSARHAFERAMRDDPDDPGLSYLEIQMLGIEQRWDLAKDRARFWLKRLQNPRYDQEELQKITSFLEEVVADPCQAIENLRRSAEELDPESERLLDWLKEAQGRPLPAYRAVEETIEDETKDKTPLTEHLRSMGLPPKEISKALKKFDEQEETRFEKGTEEDDQEPMSGNDHSLILKGPKDLPALENRWRKVCKIEKPFGAADHPMEEWDGWEPEAAKKWLAFLDKHPDAADSLDIIDDLATALLIRPDGPSPSLLLDGLMPLLQRVRTIIEEALRGIDTPLLRWNRPANRPALRSLIRLHHLTRPSLEEREENNRLSELLLALNPDDNHGLRSEMINDYLRAGQNEEAVRLAGKYPDDLFVETHYGLALAHFQLGHLQEAQAVAEKAVAEFPLVARYLVRDRVRKPKLSPYGISPGGEDQAYIYREDMRAVWQNSEGALEWLGKIMKGIGVRR